ncbi:MAG: Tex-like N-terminal domain-containing protein, partial [Spirochaetota bacterium]
MSEKKKFVIKIKKPTHLNDKDELKDANNNLESNQQIFKKTDEIKNLKKKMSTEEDLDKKDKKENKENKERKIKIKLSHDNTINDIEADEKTIKQKTTKNRKQDKSVDEETFTIQYEMPYIDFIDLISQRLSLRRNQVENTVKLLDDENTVPFIARYRKEMTGSLDEVQIREIEKQINYERNLYQRKKEVLSSILSQGKLTEELEKKILDSQKLSEV